MDEELNSMIDEGLKDMEEEKAKQEMEDRAKLSIKLVSKLLEIMNEQPEGTYDNITPEEGSSIVESLRKRYPPLEVKWDPGFIFWGNLFLFGYNTFTIDFLDKVTKLEPTEIKLLFKGLFDIYLGSLSDYDILKLGIVNAYDNGKIDDFVAKLKETIDYSELEDTTESQDEE